MIQPIQDLKQIIAEVEDTEHGGNKKDAKIVELVKKVTNQLQYILERFVNLIWKHGQSCNVSECI